MPAPMDTTLEKPTPAAQAQSTSAVAMAPDCDTKAMLPGRAWLRAKLAFRPMAGRMMPRQFGPTRRTRLSRAA